MLSQCVVDEKTKKHYRFQLKRSRTATPTDEEIKKVGKLVNSGALESLASSSLPVDLSIFDDDNNERESK